MPGFGVPFLLLSLVGVSLAATAAQWRERSIYQVFTDRFARSDGSVTADCELGYRGFCGGSWAGITSKLDYIQGMGFDAIWISPIVENVDDPTRAYHGYSTKNAYGLNSHFGTADDLHALAAELHKRGMYFMVDVVPNHFAFDGDATATNYSTMYPFDQEKYYHPICWVLDWTNVTQIQRCWLGDEVEPLPDIYTTDTNVRDMWNTWISGLVSNYSMDGIRVDTAQNIEREFFPGFGKAAGVFALGEVASYYTEYQCKYQGYIDSVLGYASYYSSVWFFNNTQAVSTDLILDLVNTSKLCTDTSIIGEFMENHDKPRFPSYTPDMSLVKNSIAYTMLKDGIPIIYQGQEQHYNGSGDPYNREPIWYSKYNTDAELYKYITSLNAFRKMAFAKSPTWVTTKADVVYYDSHTMAMSKGPKGNTTLTVVNNLGATAANHSIVMYTPGYSRGVKVVELLTCKQYTIGWDGTLRVTIVQGMVLLFYPLKLLAGTGWCGHN